MSVANKPDMPSHAIDAASAWVGHEMAARPSEWLETLTADDIEDLESASAYFLELNSDLKDIDRHNFPLRHFDNHLERLRHKCCTEWESKCYADWSQANILASFSR